MRNERVTAIVSVAIVIPWLMGIVIAKGVWATLAATVLAPYAWYLVVERVMAITGWLAV